MTDPTRSNGDSSSSRLLGSKPAPVDPLTDRAGEESPGVPGFHTWRGVYGFVFAGFVIVVILLVLFSHVYA